MATPPAMHPVNLGFRFVLELGALGAMAWWGLSKDDGLSQWALAIGVPAAAAAIWATFTVPNDPSRGGEGLIHVPGWVRLGIELAVFTAGALALVDIDQAPLGAGLGGAVFVHYALSYRRVAWLLGL